MRFMKIFDLSAKLPAKDPFTKISMLPLDDAFGVGIDKNHSSLVKFLSYTKDFGYTNVKGFYCEDNNELVQATSDTQLFEL
ncbi:hypothetical protein RDI58_004835 [Solanum bulbocastanum]|uniref:Uncharacterized protein n=1 Tax=Solanum bulbocastanum TaxID=147425 RepID=A0AAN8TYA6_SOLBU